MTYLLGAVLGALGAGWHLGVSRWRARQVTAGHPGRAWATLPVGLLGPGLAFYLALALVGEEAAWTFLLGAMLTTMTVLGIARRGRA